MEWVTGICGCCCEDCGLWALAFVCPCVVYAQNLTMMRQKGLVSYVPFCDNQAVVPGCIYGAAFYASYVSSYLVNTWVGALCIVPVLMHCITRGNIREAYQIKGCCCHETRSAQTAVYQAQCNCCEDMCCACCCMSCSLVQQQRQLMLMHQEQEAHPHHEVPLLRVPEHRNTMHVLAHR
jgi:Cys-rich protein (TIGR01571 family)